jgi:hypothetical protein
VKGVGINKIAKRGEVGAHLLSMALDIWFSEM